TSRSSRTSGRRHEVGQRSSQCHCSPDVSPGQPRALLTLRCPSTSCTLDAGIEIGKLPFLSWQLSPTRRRWLQTRKTHCGSLSFLRGKPRFSTACFCADIRRSSFAATSKCLPACLPNGTATPRDSRSCASCLNGWSNIEGTC